MRKYFTRHLISEVETEELDFVLDQELQIDREAEEELFWLGDGLDVDGELIDVDKMIKILQEMKEQGSTHVALEYHTDHISYRVCGFKVEPSDAATVEEVEKEIARKSNLSKRIIAARVALRYLEDEFHGRTLPESSEDDLPF